MESELIRKGRAYAETIFSDPAFSNRPFHNLSHTLDVVNAAEEIGKRTDMSEDEPESALIAAWLHDVGYLEGSGDHEKKATDKGRELLKEWGAPHRDIYYLGKVLGKKYKFLRIAYNIFMFGFVVSVLSFVVVMMLPQL